MGCASSSPLTVNGGPGGLVESAKSAATEIMSTGEKAINEVGENIADTVTQTKDTIVESINGVTNSLTKKSDDIIDIPLKDTNIEEMESENHLIEENLENLKNEMLSKAQTAVDEADQITDELIKDTEDVIRDAETGMVDMKNNVMERMDSMKEEVMDMINPKSPAHSIDSLKTSVPEPEIETLLDGDTNENNTSPEATVGELDKLNGEDEDVKPMEESEPTALADEEQVPESSSPPEADQPTEVKQEDDLVVEDVKSTDESSNESSMTQIGKKLENFDAVDEGSEAEKHNENEEVKQDDGPKTDWEKMHDIYFKKRFTRPLHASVESLMEDEENCRINLSKMYDENDSESVPVHAPSIQREPSVDTIDVIDELIKSIEKEVKEVIVEDANSEVPIVVNLDEN